MKQWWLNQETFPELTFNLVDGQSITLPDDIDTEFTLLLIYRAHW